jgi:hypothetical protein
MSSAARPRHRRQHNQQNPSALQYLRRLKGSTSRRQAERDRVFHQVQAEVLQQTGYQLTRDETKRLFALELHTGRYQNHMPDVRCPVLDEFHDGLYKALNDLEEHPELQELMAAAAKRPNPRGSFVSFVGQRAEFACLNAAREFVLAQGIEPGALIHDGFMVSRAGPALNLDALSAHVLSATGFRVQYVFKPMDIEREPEIELKMEPDKTLLLFEIDGLSRQLRAKNADLPAFLQRLASDFTLGIYTHRERLQVLATVAKLERTWGQRFAVFLDSESCYEPDLGYKLAYGLQLDAASDPEISKVKTVPHCIERERVLIIDVDERFVAWHDRDRSLVIPTDKFDDLQEAEHAIREFKPRRWVPTTKTAAGTLEAWRVLRPHVGIRDMPKGRVRSLLGDIDWRILLIIAGMGSGKTYRLSERAASLGPDTRILVIVPRESLADSLHARFPGFTHYKSWITDRGSMRNPRQIVCYESLHLLRNAPFFDEIYIDEARAVMENITCLKTNRGNIKDNFDWLRACIQQAKLTVFSCADIDFDDSVTGFVNDLTSADERIQMQRYPPVLSGRAMGVTRAKAKWEEALLADLRAGRLVGLCCRTRKNAEAFAERFAGEFKDPATEIKVITSRTPRPQVQEAMRDIDAALTGCRLCIITSKAAFGIDCQLLWDRVFIDATERGCLMRHLFQMGGRWRRLREPRMLVLVNEAFGAWNEAGPHPQDTTAFQESLKEIAERQEHTKDYQWLLRVLPTWDAQKSKIADFTPDCFGRLYAHRLAEEKLSDRFSFERLAALKGWPWCMDRDQVPSPNEFSEGMRAAKKLLADRERALRKRVLKAAARQDAELTPEEKDERDRMLDKMTRLDNDEDQLKRVCERARATFTGALTPEQLDYAVKHMARIRNLAQLSRVNELGWLQRDLAVAKKDFNDFHSVYKTPLHTAMVQLARLLGFPSPLPIPDSDAEGKRQAQELAAEMDAAGIKVRLDKFKGFHRVRVSAKVFEQRAELIMAQCESARKARRGRRNVLQDVVRAARLQFMQNYDVSLVSSGRGKNKFYWLVLNSMMQGLMGQSTLYRVALEDPFDADD